MKTIKDKISKVRNLNLPMSKKEKQVMFDIIYDRKGKVPKKERKMFTQDFLEDFLEYESEQIKDIDAKMMVSDDYLYAELVMKLKNHEETIDNLFRDFGRSFKLTSKNISNLVSNTYSILKYCIVTDSIKKEDWIKYISNLVRHMSEFNFGMWSHSECRACILASLVVSENVKEIPQSLFDACSVVWRSGDDDSFFKDVKSIVTDMAEVITDDMVYKLECAIVETVAASNSDTVTYRFDEDTRKKIIGIIEDVVFSLREYDMIPIIPMYMNVFTMKEYLELIIKHQKKVDISNICKNKDGIGIEIVKELVRANADNIEIVINEEADTRVEVMKEITWDSKSHTIKDYGILSKIYNNPPVAVTKSFIMYGNLKTLTSDGFYKVFNDDYIAVMILCNREDLETQFMNILSNSNGIVYLVKLMNYISSKALIPFMNAYAKYMESFEHDKSNRLSLEIYLATYIKEHTSIDTVIEHCPAMLKYIDYIISEYPSCDTKEMWEKIARNAPVINLTSERIFKRLVRLPYTQLNYKYIPHSVEEYGIEEVMDSRELCQLIALHPGYYFDIQSNGARKVIKDFLIERLKD